MDVISWLWHSFWAAVVFLVKQTWRGAWWLIKKSAQWLFKRKPDTFGSARWAKPSELRRAGAFDGKGDGLIAGKLGNRLLRFNGEGAMLVYAPMGAGKGAGVIVPNLLEYQGAVFVTDPKGENHAKTHRQRRTLTNAPVYTLNLENTDISDDFNPLDTIRLGTSNEFDDAEALANLMVIPDPQGPEHWSKKTKTKLACMILHICKTEPPETRTIATIRQRCFGGRSRFIDFVQEMTNSSHSRIQEEANDLLATLGEEDDKPGQGDEGRSIMSTFASATGLWSRDTGPGQISQKSTYNLLDVIDQGASVFFIIPEEKLAIMGPFLRVMLGLALNAVTRHRKERKQPRHKPLFVLDECAALGRLDTLESGMGYLRAYAKAILVFQDLDQIEKTYTKANSMMNACACHVAFGVNDVKTARELSDRIGQETVTTHNTGQSQSSEELLRHQNQQGSGEAGYHLLDPSEILRLGHKEALVFLGGNMRWPIKAQRIEYWKEPRWKGLHDAWGETIAFKAPLTNEDDKRSPDATVSSEATQA